MPHVNIWIRKEDYKQWLEIADKPKWIHERLSNTQPPQEVIKQKPEDILAQAHTEAVRVVPTSNWGA